MAYKITDKCIACGACAANCPVSCISDKGSKWILYPSKESFNDPIGAIIYKGVK